LSNRLLSGESLRLQLRDFFPAHRHPRAGLPSWSSVAAAWRRHRSRQRISDLDPHLLKDIGVSLAEAEAEANKPFWRA
jgi:uncharacterized protein YjiS (DUF1127 family)